MSHGPEIEDHCLFAMADQALSPADKSRLLEQFQHTESEHMGEGTHQRYLADIAWANLLAGSRLEVPRRARLARLCAEPARTWEQ